MRPPWPVIGVWILDLLIVVPTAIAVLRGESDPAGRALNSAYLVLAGLPLLVSAVLWLAFGAFPAGRWIAIAAGLVPLALLAAIPLGQMRQRHEAAKEADGSSIFSEPRTRAVAKALSRSDRAALDAAVRDDADLNACGAQDHTLLTWTIWYAPDAVPMLLDAGADPSRRTGGGDLPLQTALGREPAILTALFQAGADPNALDRNGEPFIFQTLKLNSDAWLRAFLVAKANVTVRDREGWTVLMRAVQSRMWHQARELVRRGVDLSAVSTDGDQRTVATEMARMAEIDPSIRDASEYQALIADLKAKGVVIDAPSPH